jgi:hypothetical protein
VHLARLNLPFVMSSEFMFTLDIDSLRERNAGGVASDGS